VNLVILAQILDNFVSRISQNSDFGFANGILAAPALIDVVRDKNLHKTRPFAPSGRVK
jgi:hypothetical protein